MPTKKSASQYQLGPKGASRNSGLPAHELDPWNQSPPVARLMQDVKLPESHAAPLRRFRQFSALVGWGASGYEPGSLEAAARALQDLPIHSRIGVNLEILSSLLANCEDLLLTVIDGPEGRPIFLMGIDGLLDTDRIEDHVIKPLSGKKSSSQSQGNNQSTQSQGNNQSTQSQSNNQSTQSQSNNQSNSPPAQGQGASPPPPGTPDELRMWLSEQGLSSVIIHTVTTLGDGLATMMQGDLLVLVDGFPWGAYLSLRNWPERAIDESKTEPAILAPKEAFTESIRTMTSLVRRRLRSPLLRIERFLIGVQSPTPVNLLYLHGIASPDVIAEARSRLSRVQIDSLATSAMLEELIEDQPSAFFPQFLTTERPDRVASCLLEGKVAFMMDGNPNVKIAPVSFSHFMPAPDDYEERFWYGSFILWVRLFFLVMVLFLPSVYVSVMSIHPDMLPTRILVSLAAARQGIPYPTIVEMFLMELFFEGMREATALLPRTVGGAVTTVGGLVIGQGAINSGLASPATVVIVALTGIASFAIPAYTLTTGLRVVRFGFLAAGALFGLYGVTMGMLLLLLHLAGLRSFGRPYLQPLSPFTWAELRDTLVRAPFWMLDHRPIGNRPLNPRRTSAWLKPGPKQ